MDLHGIENSPIELIEALSPLKNKLSFLSLNLTRTFFNQESYLKVASHISELKTLTSLEISLKKCYQLRSSILSKLNHFFAKIPYIKNLKLSLNNLTDDKAEPLESFLPNLF